MRLMKILIFIFQFFLSHNFVGAFFFGRGRGEGEGGKVEIKVKCLSPTLFSRCLEGCGGVSFKVKMNYR